MASERFLRALVDIVGTENATVYARKFGPLDEPFHEDILNFEALAFYAYTTAMGWHQIINEQLWSGRPTAAVRVFASALNSGLSKLDRYKGGGGLVYRGYAAPDLAQFAARYSPSRTVVFPAFTSATFHAPSAFGGNVLFTTRAINARVIWFVAADFLEHEVLFPTGCQFRVVESDRRSDRLHILLQEV